MGSYNQTCGISHLPIQAGDPVTAFLLTRPLTPNPGDFDGWTGTGPTWQVVSLPFHGSYDDYGSVDLDATGNELPDMLAAFVTGRPIAASLDMAREGEDPSQGANRGMELRMMMVHRELYERLSSQAGSAAIASEVPRIAEYLDSVRTAWARDGGGGLPRLPYGDLGDVEGWCEQTGRSWTEAPYAAKAFDRGTGISHALRMAVTAHLNRMEAAGDRAGQVAMVEPTMRLRMLDQNLLALRRSWQPQTGLGASEEDYALHRELAEWTAGKCLEADPDPDAPGL